MEDRDHLLSDGENLVTIHSAEESACLCRQFGEEASIIITLMKDMRLVSSARC